jgi:hypothetical protein
VTVVAASYQALSPEGVRFVPVAGHQLTLQVAWAADNTNTALPAFLETARQVASQTDRTVAAGLGDRALTTGPTTAPAPAGQHEPDPL